MVVEEREPETKHDFSDDENKGECEAVVYLEAELVAALEEVYAERRSHKKTSKKPTQVEKMVVDLKVQVEECRKMTKNLETQLCTKVEYCSELEAMVATLTHELDEKNQKNETYHKFENGSTKLNEFINTYRSTNIKFGLGFSESETSKAPTLGKNEVPHIKFGPGFVNTKAPQVPKKKEKEVTQSVPKVEEKKLVEKTRAKPMRQPKASRSERDNHDAEFTYVPYQNIRRFSTPQASW